MLKASRSYLVLLPLAVLFAYVFLKIYIADEQPLYLYDYGDYQRLTADFAARLHQGFSFWFHSATYYIGHLDYNPSSILPICPLFLAFGDSRFVYVFALACLYLVPTVVLCTRMTAATFAAPQAPLSAVETSAVLVATFLFWPLWIPLVRGYSDIAGLIPLGLALLLVLRTGFLTTATLGQGILLGAMLWLSFMLRRWYALIVMPFEAATAVFILWSLFRDAGGGLVERARRPLAAYLAGAATIAALLFVLQRPLVHAILSHRYAEEYAMYKQPLTATIAVVYGFLGPAATALIVIGNVVALREGNRSVLFPSLVFLLGFAAFYRIQTPDIHHTMGLVFWLIPALMHGAVRVVRAPKGGAALAGTIFVLYVGAAFATVFVPASYPDALAFALPSERTWPLRAADFAQDQRLIAELARLATPERRAVVFAESTALDASLLISIDASLAEKLTDPNASLVDLRDGFDFATLAARYAVVAAPAMVDHPEAQHVVVIPNDMILAGTCIGAAYAKVAGPFDFADHSVFVYERTREVSDSERDCLVAALRAYYPTWVRTPVGVGPARGAP